MDVYYAYTYSTAGWLAVQAAPLLISPTMIITLLSPEVREPTTLETYFSRSLALIQLTLAATNLLLTGSVPLSSSLRDGVVAGNSADDDPKAPYALPALTITTLYHSAAAFYSYILWTEAGVTSFSLGTFGSGVLAAIGIWCILFASTNGRISKKTGADKRTSGFPFKNVEADKKKGKKTL